MPKEERRPTSFIAELYGRAPDVYTDPTVGASLARQCPFRHTTCDVSANRNSVARLRVGDYKGIADASDEILRLYGNEGLPLGICSCWTTRQNEDTSRPWILCPKRLLALEPPLPIIPNEVRKLIEITPGTRVGVWRELKFRRNDQTGKSKRFFEYTFDYLLMAIDESDEPIGVPYIIEVMTSSTRGGGLSEHMADVLLGRPQRYLGDVVDSVYTPNYRQVFERMIGQFVVKSEIAEVWGGKAIWIFQDVLLDYIEQTTAFDSSQIASEGQGNVFAEVYRLEKPAIADPTHPSGLHLVHHKSLRGRARLAVHKTDYTSFLGLGYAPPLDELKNTLRRKTKELKRKKQRAQESWFEFRWGEETDPRQAELQAPES